MKGHAHESCLTALHGTLGESFGACNLDRDRAGRCRRWGKEKKHKRDLWLLLAISNWTMATRTPKPKKHDANQPINSPLLTIHTPKATKVEHINKSTSVPFLLGRSRSRLSSGVSMQPIS
jgi:hypothetical protein